MKPSVLTLIKRVLKVPVLIFLDLVRNHVDEKWRINNGASTAAAVMPSVLGISRGPIR